MMQLPAEQYVLSLPPIGQLVSVEVTREDIRRTLLLVDIERIYELLDKGAMCYGPPHYAAIEHDTLFLYPIADIEYEVKIQYYPPLQEV
jgi:hypothetical protein